MYTLVRKQTDRNAHVRHTCTHARTYTHSTQPPLQVSTHMHTCAVGALLLYHNHGILEIEREHNFAVDISALHLLDSGIRYLD